jgi:hypothetical protein
MNKAGAAVINVKEQTQDRYGSSHYFEKCGGKSTAYKIARKSNRSYYLRDYRSTSLKNKALPSFLVSSTFRGHNAPNVAYCKTRKYWLLEKK